MSRHMFTPTSEAAFGKGGILCLHFRKPITAAITYHLAKDTAPINTVQHEVLKDALSSWSLTFFLTFVKIISHPMIELEQKKNIAL